MNMDTAVLAKDGILGLLLFVNMIYLGRKIDRLAEAIWSAVPAKRRKGKR